MTLHISINSVNDDNIKIINRLFDFLKHKDYRVYKVHDNIYETFEILESLKKYELSNTQKILLNALERNIIYYNQNWENYDIVLWNNSIIDDYSKYTDNKNTKNYITHCNKYIPKMDLNIILIPIRIKKHHKKITDNYTALSYEKKNIKLIKKQKNFNKLFKQIIETIFENLPRCQWCGRFFTPTKHYKKYCKKTCQKYGLQDQRRINNRNYYYKYKDVMSERQKGGLGSKGANLHGTPDPNPLKELEKIRNAKKALGL